MPIQTFVTAYLTVFDWTLIWIIEYADIAKFWLIGICPFVGSAYGGFLYHHERILLCATTPKSIIPAWRYSLPVDCCFVWDQMINKNGQVEYHSLYLGSYVFLIVLIGLATRLPKHGSTRNWWAITNVLICLVLALAVFGRTMGTYVRDVNSNRYSILLKDKSKAE